MLNTNRNSPIPASCGESQKLGMRLIAAYRYSFLVSPKRITLCGAGVLFKVPTVCADT